MVAIVTVGARPGLGEILAPGRFLYASSGAGVGLTCGRAEAVRSYASTPRGSSTQVDFDPNPSRNPSLRKEPMLCNQELEAAPFLYGNDPCATVTVATIRNLGTCKSFIIFGLGGFGLKRVDADKAARTGCAAAYLQVIEHLTPEGGGRLS